MLPPPGNRLASGEGHRGGGEGTEPLDPVGNLGGGDEVIALVLIRNAERVARMRTKAAQEAVPRFG